MKANYLVKFIATTTVMFVGVSLSHAQNNTFGGTKSNSLSAKPRAMPTAAPKTTARGLMDIGSDFIDDVISDQGIPGGFTGSDVTNVIGGLGSDLGIGGSGGGKGNVKYGANGDLSGSDVAGDAASDSRMLTLMPGHDVNNLLLAHDGWDPDFNAYEKTPILFDSVGANRNRQYPKLSTGPDGIQNVSVSTDDEVMKSSLAIYRPVSEIQTSFAENQTERDNHLDMFKRLRGVAILTLSYLDKTVAAGLATVQQQVDMDTIHQLLKQISWTNSKIANPQRSQLYEDTEEKLNLCMALNGGTASALDNKGYFDPKKVTSVGQDTGLGHGAMPFSENHARINLSCKKCDDQFKAKDRGGRTVQESAYH